MPSDTAGKKPPLLQLPRESIQRLPSKRKPVPDTEISGIEGTP